MSLHPRASCFALAKVVRDRHESDRLYNKVERVKTEKFSLKGAVR